MRARVCVCVCVWVGVCGCVFVFTHLSLQLASLIADARCVLTNELYQWLIHLGAVDSLSVFEYMRLSECVRD
jgi:hypothetical protein